MDKLYFEEKGPGILERIGMSKAEFARRMGVKRQNVNALFKSRKIETIRQAADVMGVPFEMLIGYTSERDLPVGYPASDCVPGAELLPDIPAISSRIRVIRGVQIILDRDLAPLYQVEVGQMNRQVKRNITRFPEDFMFQLTRSEYDALKCQNGISNTRGGDRSLPYAFTEQGVSMLSGLLRSDVAIQVNILIMRAFVSLRRGLVAGSQLTQRMDRLEHRQAETDNKVERLLEKFSQNAIVPSQGIFFDGQVYDAYSFVSRLIRSAKGKIAVIDNYVNDEVLTMLDKRNPGVKATIYTRTLSDQFRLDLSRHNAQYAVIEVIPFGKAHDRFLLIDEDVYHIGASLKDLGKKWFAFSRMEDLSPGDLLSQM